MRVTSPAYSPYSDVRWVDFTIRFELLDETARTTAVPSTSNKEDFSQLEQLTDKIEEMSERWSTLELNNWPLNGKQKIMPDDVTDLQVGWWTDKESMSDENGIYNDPPSLTYHFQGSSISTIGFMLYFDEKSDSFPTSIRVTTYEADQTTIKTQETISNDKFKCVIDMPVQGYYEVRFEFLASSKPFRRVRLVECLFGIVQEFDGDSLQPVYITYGADIIAETFPSRQLEFVFDNSDKKYNFINPSGLYDYLQQGQDIYPKSVINDEEIDMGKFEFTSAQAGDDEITGRIIANDIALLSLESVFDGGSDTITTLENAVNAVLGDIDIEVSLAYPSCQVSMAIPQGTTKREALRMLAQAARCSIWVDRDGILQIRPLITTETADDELTADNMPSMGGIGVSEPFDYVELTVQNEYTNITTVYTSGSGRRVKAISNPCVYSGNGQAVADWILAQCNRRIRYDKPNRGNPAVEIGDTLKIYDAYGENRNAVVVGQEIYFDGSLSARTKAVG